MYVQQGNKKTIQICHLGTNVDAERMQSKEKRRKKTKEKRKKKEKKEKKRSRDPDLLAPERKARG